LNSVLDLLFELLDPTVGPHTTFNWVHCRVLTFVTNLVQTLLHSALELVRNLGISITMEYAPGLHGWLREHLGLDLSIDLSSVLLDVELVWCTTASCSHD